ncbi:MAG: flavin prenyltransferase UbiX [Thiotrichaceae bacterium]
MPIITLAITGASGSIYGLRLLEQLITTQCTVYLLISAPARIVLETELGVILPTTATEIQTFLAHRYQAQPQQLHVFELNQWSAAPASGSAKIQAMVVCPCSGGTLSAIASGLSRSLIERAAEVTLKEQRKLILVTRETPLSVIHLENMLRLARLGCVILPASPGFYYQPQRIEQLVDFIVARILDQLDIPHNLLPRWGEDVQII